MHSLKLLLLTVIAALTCECSHGQKYFETYFLPTSSIQGFYAEGDTIFAVGVELNWVTEDPEGVLYRIVDSEVEEIYRVAVQDERHTFFSISGNKQLLIIGGVTHFADGTQGPSYYIYDRETQTHERVTFHEGGGSVNHITKLSAGGFVLTGSINYWEGLIIRYPQLTLVGADGDLLWTKIYDEYESRSRWFTGFQDAESNFWAQGFIDADDQAITATPITVQINLNDGETITEHSYEDFSAGLLRNVLADSNDQWYVTGSLDQNSDCLYKLSSSKAVEWILPLSNQNTCGASNMAFVGSSIIHVSSCYSDPNELGSTDARIAIVDTGGALVRSVIYGGDNADYFYAMIPTSDGGFLHGGRTDSFEGARAYLVKANCMGFLTEPEANYDYSLNDLEIEFQNLSQFVYPDSLDGGHFIWEVNGVEFSRDENPSFTFTEMGAYNLTLSAIVCSDTSVYNQCISLDGTECWGLGLEENALVNDVVLKPNPTSDWISIEVDRQISTVRIFDINGRLVQQEKEKNFSVAALLSGVYFVELELETGELVRKKLVRQ